MFWAEMQKGIFLVVHQFFTDMHNQIFHRYAQQAIFQNICLEVFIEIYLGCLCMKGTHIFLR